MSISNTLRSLFGRREILCPNEAEILAYYESGLSARSRARLERHFAGCDDCRELLVLLGRKSAEIHAALPDEVVREQTNKVLSLIHSDELNRNKEQKRQTVPAFQISYPRVAAAALIFCAIAVAAIVLLNGGQRPSEAAMEALKLAVKDKRFTEARISGGLGYSRYPETRGLETNNDDLQFSRAISKLRFAEQENAPVNDRLALARVYLARGTREDATHALTILGQLLTRGVETPEAINDAGVAQFELGNYEDAISYFTRALAKSPSYNEAQFNRALADERAHHNKQAKKDWEQFVNQASDDSWKTEARTHLSFLTGAK